MQTSWRDNRSVASHSTEEIAVVNPANEEVIATLPQGYQADADAAVAAACRRQSSAPPASRFAK